MQKKRFEVHLREAIQGKIHNQFEYKLQGYSCGRLNPR